MEITSKLITELENKLKQDLKENYKGLWSVAICLVNRYFSYHNNPEEYMYFTDYKMLTLAVELMVWLSENRINKTGKKFNFEKILRQAEENLQYIKVRIYNRWINNDLRDLLSKAQLKQIYNTDDERLKYYIEMLQDLIEKFPKPSAKENWEFKEIIHLE